MRNPTGGRKTELLLIVIQDRKTEKLLKVALNGVGTRIANSEKLLIALNEGTRIANFLGGVVDGEGAEPTGAARENFD